MPKNRSLGRPPNATRRQQIAQLRALGWELGPIARHLGCSREAVRYYVGRGKEVKLSVSCRCCGKVISDKPICQPNSRTTLCLPCLRKIPNPSFGQRLKAHRLAAGLTVAEVSEQVGVSKKRLLTYERGMYTSTSWRPVALLAGVLGIGLLTDPPPSSSDCGRATKG